MLLKALVPHYLLPILYDDPMNRVCADFLTLQIVGIALMWHGGFCWRDTRSGTLQFDIVDIGHPVGGVGKTNLVAALFQLDGDGFLANSLPTTRIDSVSPLFLAVDVDGDAAVLA